MGPSRRDGLQAPPTSSEPSMVSQDNGMGAAPCAPAVHAQATSSSQQRKEKQNGVAAARQAIQKVAPGAAVMAVAGIGNRIIKGFHARQSARQQAVEALEGKVAQLEQQLQEQRGATLAAEQQRDTMAESASTSEAALGESQAHVTALQQQQARSGFLLSQTRRELVAAQQQLNAADYQLATKVREVCALTQQLATAQAVQQRAGAAATRAAKAASAFLRASNKARRMATSACKAARRQAQAAVAAAEQRATAAQARAETAAAQADAASAAQAIMQAHVNAMVLQLEGAESRAVSAESAASSAAAAAVEVEGRLAAAQQQAAAAQVVAAAERDTLQQAAAALQARVADLEGQIFAQRQQLAAQQVAVEAAQQRAAAVATRAAKAASAFLRASNKARHMATSACKAARRQAQATVAAAEQRATAAQARAETAAAQANAASAAQAAAEQQSAAVLAHMQSNVDAMALLLEGAESRAVSAESVASSAAAAVVEVQGRLVAAQEQAATAQAAAAAERDSLQQAAAALENQVGELEGRLSEEQQAAVSLQTRVKELEGQMGQQQEAAAALRQRLDATAASAAASQAALLKAKQSRARRGQRLLDMAAQLQEEAAARNAAEAAATAAREEAQLATAKVEVIVRLHRLGDRLHKEDRAEREAAISSLSQQLSAGEVRATAADARAAAAAEEAEGKVAAAKQQAAAAAADSQDKVAAVQQQCQALHSSMCAVQRDRDEALAQAAGLAAELAAAKAAVSNGQQEVDKISRERDAALAATAAAEAARLQADEKAAIAITQVEAANAAAAAAQEETIALRSALEAALAATAAGDFQQGPGAAAGATGRLGQDAGEEVSSNSSSSNNNNSGGSSNGGSARTRRRNANRRRNKQGATSSNHSDETAPIEEPVPGGRGIKAAQVPTAAQHLIAGLEAVSVQLQKLAEQVTAAKKAGDTAAAEAACTTALRLAHDYTQVAAPVVQQEGDWQVAEALSKLLLMAAKATAWVDPATADILLRRAASFHPEGQLPEGGGALAADVAEWLGFFGKAAAVRQRDASVATEGVHMQGLLEGQAEIEKIVCLLKEGAGLAEQAELSAALQMVRVLRGNYAHSQLLLLLEVLLCAQLHQPLAQVLDSLPTYGPELTAAMAAVVGIATYDVAGQSSTFWKAWLGVQVGMAGHTPNLRGRSNQMGTAAMLYTPITAAGGDAEAGTAAAGGLEAASKYMTLLGHLYPTPADLEAAQEWFKDLLESEGAAHTLVNTVGTCEDVGAVAVAPLHPYWACEVYLAQGRAWERQGQPVLAMRSFAQAAGLSKSGRPAFAAEAYCCAAEVLHSQRYYMEAHQLAGESYDMWLYALDPAKETWRSNLGVKPKKVEKEEEEEEEQEQEQEEEQEAPVGLGNWVAQYVGDAKAFSRTMHPDKARLACAYTHLTAKHTATPVFDRPWRRERISANLSKTCGWVYGKLNVSVTDDPLAADPSADDPATAGVVLSLT